MYEIYLTRALSSIIVAKQSLHNYKITNIKDMKNKASYNIQQAFEYIIKYLIYNNSMYPRTRNGNIRELYIHDLDRLITLYCIPYGIQVPKLVIRNADRYSKWEAESRYSLNYSVRIDSLINAINIAEQWLIEIKPIYKAKLADVNRKLNL